MKITLAIDTSTNRTSVAVINGESLIWSESHEGASEHTESLIKLINDAIKTRPKDMVVTMHLCRGNFEGAWVAEGGYEPVAEAMFSELDVDGFFLEYDDARSGDFKPLRFVPKGKKRVVLGLVTSKFGTLERADDIKRRVDEATRYADIDQLCLSPQCGFASTHEGNLLSEEEQWTKLRLVVDVARDVWGS